MKAIQPTVTSLPKLYANFLDGGEDGWFAFVRNVEKFYYWVDERWSELIFTDTITINSWKDTFADGEYIVIDNSVDTPSALTGDLKLIVYTNYLGKQVKIVQSGSYVFYLSSGEVSSLIWGEEAPEGELNPKWGTLRLIEGDNISIDWSNPTSPIISARDSQFLQNFIESVLTDDNGIPILDDNNNIIICETI